MAKVLLAHASFDGCTRAIAARIATTLIAAGHTVTQCRVEDVRSGALEAHDAVVLGSAVRYGKHKPSMRAFVKAHVEALDGRANAFFSVCLSAGGPNPNPALAGGYIEAFCRHTGWTPHQAVSFAGSLPYRSYNPLLRLMMRFIAGRAGGETDTSRDHAYTDWTAVDHFANDFAAGLKVAEAA